MQESKQIDWLYQMISLKDYTYDMLDNESKLHLIDDMKHVSLNYAGMRCFLIFNTLNRKYHSYLINKQTLTYSKPNNYSKVEILNIKMSINPHIYDGTIFDGIYIKGKFSPTLV